MKEEFIYEKQFTEEHERKLIKMERGIRTGKFILFILLLIGLFILSLYF